MFGHEFQHMSPVSFLRLPAVPCRQTQVGNTQSNMYNIDGGDQRNETDLSCL